MAQQRVQRRLAAILATDVVGCSRLMGEDEEGTLATLKSYRDVIDELIQTHDGRVFGGAGDSVVAEFASSVEAVRCARADSGISPQARVLQHSQLLADLPTWAA